VVLWKRIKGGVGGFLRHLTLLKLVVGMEESLGEVCVLLLAKKEL
jgi:hypothetical protein